MSNQVTKAPDFSYIKISKNVYVYKGDKNAWFVVMPEGYEEVVAQDPKILIGGNQIGIDPNNRREVSTLIKSFYYTLNSLFGTLPPGHEDLELYQNVTDSLRLHIRKSELKNMF